MPAEGTRTRIAVLIDADNASPRHADAMFVEIAKLGEAIVRRVYGDFGNSNLKGWCDRLARFALVPVQTVAFTKGKNASDISLVIDAMDLMHSKLYDAFCIVSSDSDFTRLAQRLRESGAEVYGIGEAKTPESFQKSCRRFFLVENLAREQAREAKAAGASDADPAPEARIRPAAEAADLIMQAYSRHAADHAEGWAQIRNVQRTILNIDPGFDTRSFGETRLGELAARTGRFEARHEDGRGWTMRAKTAAGRAAASTADGAARPRSGTRRPRAASGSTPAPKAAGRVTRKKPAEKVATAGDVRPDEGVARMLERSAR